MVIKSQWKKFQKKIKKGLDKSFQICYNIDVMKRLQQHYKAKKLKLKSKGNDDYG